MGAVLALAGSGIGLALSARHGEPGRSATATKPPGTASTGAATTLRPGTTTTAPTTTTSLGCVAAVATWTLTRLADQVLVVIGTFDDLASLQPEASGQVGGLVFAGRPEEPASSLSSELATLRAAASGAGDVRPWFATNEEGGEVTPLSGLIGPLPSARQMASGWNVTEVTTAARGQGEAMLGLGLTMDLAPVLDAAAPDDPVDDEASRSFSTSPAVITAYALAFAAGLEQAGVTPVVKHFPGLGHADADTDVEPATDPSLATLEQDDLIPFEHAIAAGLPVLMVSSAVVPGLTAGLPASLAPGTYRYLRTTLGFTGVTVTDSLGAGAVSGAGYQEPAAAVAALAAGADLAMVDASTWQACRAAVVAAAEDGGLARTTLEAAVGRILHAKQVGTCPT